MRISYWSSDVGSSDLSLYDLPQAWGATTRHKEAEGSSYYRHFHMGLLRADGSPKAALHVFAQLEGQMGICQWFHFEDPRLADEDRKSVVKGKSVSDRVELGGSHIIKKKNN